MPIAIPILMQVCKQFGIDDDYLPIAEDNNQEQQHCQLC